MSQPTETTLTAQFTTALEAIVGIAAQHPDYRFELIQPWVDQLQNRSLTVAALATQLSELSPERQRVGLDMFEYALLRARQATYQPRNALDTFIEQQLYGVQDAQAIEKSLVGEFLRQQEAAARPPKPAVDNLPFIEQSVGRPKTQPLPPNQVPPRPMPPQTQPLPPRPPRKP